MGNINDSYFDGYYKDIWRKIIPEQLTVKEVDFMVSYFDLKPGSKVLDLMCGYGRHAIALAKKGIEVTAVDNLHDYIDEIEYVVQKENLSIQAVKADVIQFHSQKTFDLVICMGNSFNFFNPKEVEILLSNVYSYLVPGGYFLINTWSLSEIVSNNFTDRAEAEIEGMRFTNHSKHLQSPNRVETESVILTADGATEIKIAIDYIYSIPEMETMFRMANLKLCETYSIPGKKLFTIGEPRAYIITRK
jgi:cyclopropane fatty-acyl-phospholipid synthase-like methyltransferase